MDPEVEWWPLLEGLLLFFRKTVAALLLLLCSISSVIAKPSLSYAGGERFAEDWSRMLQPQARTRPWHGLKWIDLGGETKLSLGADAKWRERPTKFCD